MKKTAIYPGTFDPITFGHIDVIQKSLKIFDKLIVAISNGNQKNYLFSIDERIEKQGYFTWANKPSEEDYISQFEKYSNPLVTLHGWLRIVPPYVCERTEIYNGHPGLITKYPELKGKDPQVRAYEGKYKTIGCVLHKVSAGVDEGEIISEVEYSNDFQLELEEIFRILKDKSLTMWTQFLKKVL